MLEISMGLVSLIVGIIVAVVAISALSGIVTQFTCPTGATQGLQKVLQDACNLFTSFGGAIVILVVIIGLVSYLTLFRH